MKKNIIIIIAVIILIVGGLLFFSLKKSSLVNQQEQEKQAKSQEEQEEPSIESIATNAVSIKNQTFIPKQVNVGKGTTVVWTNEDSVSHSIKGKGFESPILKKGDSYTFSFNEAGTFEYSCGIHPKMKGMVGVE